MDEQLFKLFSKDLVDDNDDSKKLQLLKSIIKNWKKLEGGKMIYVRTYYQMEGNLKKIEFIEKNLLRIIMGWKSIMGWESKKKAEFVFDIDDDLDIVVDSGGINFFQNLNGKNFTSRITILFKETQ